MQLIFLINLENDMLEFSYAKDKKFTDEMHNLGYREKGLCLIKEVDENTIPWEHYWFETWVNPKNAVGDKRKVFIWIKE